MNTTVANITTVIKFLEGFKDKNLCNYSLPILLMHYMNN